MAKHIYFFSALIYLAMQVNAVTSWIESSWSGKLGEDTLDEIRLMASEGNARLLNSGDEIMADAFLTIFKVDKTNTATSTTATTAFQKIAAMTPSGNFESSDVRIYCDNDQRWKLVLDLTTSARKSKNSKKAPICNYDEGILAQTYHAKDEEGKDEGLKAGQSSGREVITICDFGFANGFNLFNTIPTDNDDDSKLFMSHMEDLDSITLFHEMCHLKSTIAIPGTDDKAIGWNETIILCAERAITEADPFAFLAFTGLLNKNNIRLSANGPKAGEGVSEWILEPTQPDSPPTRKRALRFVA